MNKLNNGLISSSQFMFAISVYLQGSILLTTFFTSIAKHDSWIIIFLGFLVFIPLIFIYTTLIKKFKGKNLIEINDAVYGPIIGKIISVIYIWFFISLTSLNLKNAGTFVNDFLMPRTPVLIVLVMFMFICTWAVRNGLEVVIRYGGVIVAFSYVVSIAGFILLPSRIDFKNFLPILSLPPIDYIQSTNIFISFPLGDTVVFLMIAPYVKEQSRIRKSFFLGVIIGLITLLIVILRDTAVLGPAAEFLVMPYYESLRLASIANALNRMEVLFAIIVLTLLFFKIIILFYCVSAACAQLFSMKSYRPLVTVLGAIIISYAILMFDNSLTQFHWGSDSGAIFYTLFSIILPAITLITAKIKEGFLKKKESLA